MSVFEMDSYNLTLIGSTVGLGLLFYNKDGIFKKSKKCLEKCAMKSIKLRSDYIWKHRNEIRKNIRLRIDKLLKINSNVACVNSSNILSERISIGQCIEISKNGGFIMSRITEIDNLKYLMDLPENEGFIKLNKNEVFKIFGLQEYPWYLKIEYSGHSNIQKRIPSRRFTVLYKFEEDSSFVFPPYSANETIQGGFSAPKIKSAKSLSTGKLIDCNPVKEHAGLKCDFYESCEIKEVVKNYLDHVEDIVVSLKKKDVIVNDEL